MASGFVSASELDEEKKKRQDEWEKVRKPEDPVAAPEPEVCNKTLFEQLRDNKEVKDAEYEEAKKFKNMIRGIDEDESDFLSRVDDMKAEVLRNKRKEEEQLMREMAEARGQLIEPATIASIHKITPASTSQPPKSKQASILSAAIKRKSTASVDDATTAPKAPRTDGASGELTAKPAVSALKVIGSIPGMGDYAASSDSNSSDDSSDDECATLPLLVTAEPVKKKNNDNEH